MVKNISKTMPPPLLVIVAALLTAARSQAAPYIECNRPFSCGSVSNSTFPFTGGDRPSFCGRPEFALTCRSGAIAELSIESIAYRVLRFDQSRKTLVLSRSDLYSDPCNPEFQNTTLESTPFASGERQNKALTLFYGCNTSAVSVRPDNLFSCDSRGLNFTGAYYFLGPVPRDSIPRILHCERNVIVPVSIAAGDRLAASEISLAEALREGFVVNYTDPNEEFCSLCNSSDGHCGFDSVVGQPVCICLKGFCVFPLKLPASPTDAPLPIAEKIPSGSTTGRDTALSAAGAVLAFLGLWLLFLYCRHRRKQHPAPQAAQFWGRGIDTLPSNPSHNLTSGLPLKSDISQESSYLDVQVFSCAELVEATNNFDPSQEVGIGGFGTVYRALLSDGRTVAVKRLYDHNFNRLEQFMNEVKILTRLRHQNLVKLYGCTSRHSHELLLVYEYIPNGTVSDHLHGAHGKSVFLSWPNRLNIAVETAEALAYLHRSDVIHRDVKTNNILLDSDFHVKVVDFGLSKLFPIGATHISTSPQGTLGYVDPDYYQCFKLTEKSDVFSFGVVLIELISSLQAVDIERNHLDVKLSSMAVRKILDNAVEELVDPGLGFGVDVGVKREVTIVAGVALRCLQVESEMRPTMEEVLRDLKGIKKGYDVEVLDVTDDAVELLNGVVVPVSPGVVFDRG